MVSNAQAVLAGLKISMIENFYWEAIQAVGWPTGKGQKGHKISGPYLPGYKILRYDNVGKGFVFIDMWSTPHIDRKSEGKTTIWFMDIPVWVMNYGGQYPKEAIPFLKLALMEMIEAKHFYGGRGNSYYINKNFSGLVYQNYLERVSFSGFSGVEKVYKKALSPDDPEDVLLGDHHYQGMSLI